MNGEGGNSRSFHQDWSVGLFYSPSTSKRCQTCQKPAASKLPWVGSRALSMVLTTKRGHRLERNPWRTLIKTPLLYRLTPSLASFALWFALSTWGANTRVAGRVAAGALATLCSPQAPTADAAQGNQLLRTRPVPGALPRPMCCLSWANPPRSSCLL